MEIGLINKVINRLLDRYLGLRIVRSKRDSDNIFFLPEDRLTNNQTPKPIYIEFVGISGVGKSTLFSLINLSKCNGIALGEFKKQKLLRDTRLSLTDDSLYQFLGDRKMSEVYSSERIIGIDKMWYIKYFFDIMVDDFVVYKRNLQNTILSDEGLVHNFDRQIEELYDESESGFNNLMKGRAIVYCYSSANLVAEQIMKRFRETGSLLPHHRFSNIKDLVKDQEEELEKKSKFIEFLCMKNIPVLKIDTAGDLRTKTELIYSFINNLQSPKTK